MLETDAESTEKYSEYIHTHTHTCTHTHKHTHMHECWNASIIFIHHRRLHECQERVQDLPVIVITNMVPRTLKDLKSAIHTAQTRLQHAHSISTITAIWLIPLAHTANHCWQIRKRTSLTWQAISITHWQTADFFSLFLFFCFVFCFIRKHSLISCYKKDKLHAEKKVLLG